MRELIFPKNITQRMKKVTTRLYKNMNSLRTPLNSLEGYVLMTAEEEKLTVLPKDFGKLISKVNGYFLFP